MSRPKPDSKKYTYADYLQWPGEQRWELIDGVPYDMSPAPSRTHQKVLLDLARIIADITDKGSCETYVAPLDIRLTEALHLDGEPEDKKWKLWFSLISQYSATKICLTSAVLTARRI